MRELHAMISWMNMLPNWPFIRKLGVTVHIPLVVRPLLLPCADVYVVESVYCLTMK
jgi:hypothetical protein